MSQSVDEHPECMQMPITSLDMIVNGDSVVEEDLVAWVSMGILHVPRQEVSPPWLDLPCLGRARIDCVCIIIYIYLTEVLTPCIY